MATHAHKQYASRGGALWLAAKLAFALGLIALVATQLRPNDLLTLWQALSLPWALAAAGMFGGGLLAMAWRYWHLLEGRVPLRDAVELVVAQTVASNLLASSAGVASYLALLLSRHGISLGRSVVVFVLARLGDLLVLAVALGATAALHWQQIATLRWPVLGALLGLCGILVAVGLVIALRERVVGLIHAFCIRLGLMRIGLVERGLERAALLGAADPARVGRLSAPLLLQSLVNTCCLVGYAYCSLRMFGVSIDPSVVLFVVVINLLIAAIPIQIFGGLGVVEVTTIALYGLFGVQSALLAPVMINGRIFFSLLNLVALIYLALSGRGRRAQGRAS
jgi:uncharacterized membrane protein YbhN (UPF0104 family)